MRSRFAEGAESETPKASSGKGKWGGYPPPHPTRGFGERRELLQRGPPQTNLVHIEDLKTHLVASMNKQSKTLKITVGLHDNNVLFVILTSLD